MYPVLLDHYISGVESVLNEHSSIIGEDSITFSAVLGRKFRETLENRGAHLELILHRTIRCNEIPGFSVKKNIKLI